ncbi:hypothetical protein KAR91_70865 [Candidatus Pacearchaeota archaeon]|nr:hypothetical protein [Candidatus Pacearchaeota archaeon]
MEAVKKVIETKKKDASKATIFKGHSKMTYKQFKVWFDRHYFGDIDPHLKELGIKAP